MLPTRQHPPFAVHGRAAAQLACLPCDTTFFLPHKSMVNACTKTLTSQFAEPCKYATSVSPPCRPMLVVGVLSCTEVLQLHLFINILPSHNPEP